MLKDCLLTSFDLVLQYWFLPIKRKIKYNQLVCSRLDAATYFFVSLKTFSWNDLSILLGRMILTDGGLGNTSGGSVRGTELLSSSTSVT